MTETIVIYHGGCRDGFCAAWVVNKYLKEHVYEKRDLIYYPGFYGQEPPDCKGKDVIIVDFCYPLDTMINIALEAHMLTWLDHHKTAQPFVDHIQSVGKGIDEVCNWVFNNDKSGAGIAWDYFFPNEPRPWLVDYVEDRDLWRKQLDNTDRVNAYIACLEFKFEVWDLVNIGISLDEAITFGDIAEKKTEQYVREVCKNVYFVDITRVNSDLSKDDYYWDNIPVVNICQVDCSEVLHELCKLYPNSLFSMYWFKRADGMYQYGLRSIGAFDVSSVAKLFGGGGHKNAAGFQLEYLLEELK